MVICFQIKVFLYSVISNILHTVKYIANTHGYSIGVYDNGKAT